MTRPLSVTLLICICFLLANAQEPKPNTNNQTWGFYAEEQFKRLYNSCQLINAQDKFNKLVQKKSIVPSSLTETLRLDPSLKIAPKPGVNIALVFDFIYDGTKTSNSDRLNGVSAANPKDRFDAAGNIELISFGVDPNAASVIYRQNCAGTAIVALSAKYDFLSFGNVNAQVNADSKADSELLFVRSTAFRSPIFSILHGDQRPAKLALMLQLWNKWTDPANPLTVAAKPEYLTGFQGMMISVGSKSKSSFTVKGGAQAGINLPVFSFSGDASLEYSTTTSITMNNPDVLFETKNSANKDEPIMFFEAVPTPGQIAEFAAKLLPATEGGGELSSGNVYSQAAIINGIPKGICEANVWSIEEPESELRKVAGNEKLNLSLASHVYDANRGCVFVVSTTNPLSPTSTLFGPNTVNTTYQLSYGIVYNVPYQSGNEKSFIKYNVSAKLTRQLDFVTTPVSGASSMILSDGQVQKKIQWTRTFRVIDLKSQVANGRAPMVNNVRSNCSHVAPDGSGTSGTLDNSVFKLDTTFSLQEQKKVASVNGPPCMISFDMQIPKKDNSLTPTQTVTFDVASPILATPEITVTVTSPQTPPTPKP